MNAANIKNDDYNFKHSNHWTINDRNINHWQRKATCWPSQQSSSQSMLIFSLQLMCYMWDLTVLPVFLLVVLRYPENKDPVHQWQRSTWIRHCHGQTVTCSNTTSSQELLWSHQWTHSIKSTCSAFLHTVGNSTLPFCDGTTSTDRQLPHQEGENNRRYQLRRKNKNCIC